MIKKLFDLPFVGRIITSKVGGIATVAGTSVVSFIITFLTAHGLKLDPATQILVSTAVAGLLSHLLMAAILYWRTGNTQELQAVVNQALNIFGIKPLEEDGWAGDKTKGAVAMVIRKAALATDEDVVKTLAQITPKAVISTNTTPTGYPLGTRK